VPKFDLKYILIVLKSGRSSSGQLSNSPQFFPRAKSRAKEVFHFDFVLKFGLAIKLERIRTPDVHHGTSFNFHQNLNPESQSDRVDFLIGNS